MDSERTRSEDIAAPLALSSRAACLGRMIALGFGLLLALALIEIGGRLVLGFTPLPGWAQDFSVKTGYELRPDQEYTYASSNGEFENRVENNSRGLHDIEHPLEKPASTFRVLILGDSYAQAREVPLDQNFVRQLAELLNASAPDDVSIEVINAGHFGLGTTQEYLYYIEEGYRYTPDLVLLGFYVGNDVVDNHAPLIKAWNDVDRVDFPYMDPDGTLHQPGLATQRRVPSWLRQNVFLINVLSDTFTGAMPDRVEVGASEDVSDHVLRVPMGIYLPPDTTWTDAWTVTELALGKLRTAVHADGAQLAAFVIPDRRQVIESEWDATLDRLPDIDHAQLDRERPTDTIRALFDALDIPALSLLQPFRAAEERVYLELDGHFSPAGHTLTAQALAEWLVGADLVPNRDS